MPAPATRRLEISEDPEFQRRDWRIQRIGWGILALIVFAGLAGLLGPGPLSKTAARGGDSLEVEYERFLRHGAPSELLVKVITEEPGARPVRIAISRAYLSGLDLKQVTPEPLRVQSVGHSIVYVFARAAGSSSLHAKFAFQPEEIGTHRGAVAADDGARVSIQQFAYP